jgi:hypothetical protein
MSLLEEASGLVANYSKGQAYPIHCSGEQIALVRSILSHPIFEFSCTYLGVALSIRKLPKSAL